MGYSLPAAIGAFYAAKQVDMIIAFMGDGGIQMNIQELQTIVRENIAIKIVLFNNKSLGLIRDYQSKALNHKYNGSVLGFTNPDFRKLSQAYGLEYFMIKNNADFNYLPNLLKTKKSTLKEVVVSENSVIIPEMAYKCSVYNRSE